MNQAQIIERLTAEAQAAGSQKALAAAIGISAPYLNDILLGKRAPGSKVLDWMGLEKRTVYVKVQKDGKG